MFDLPRSVKRGREPRSHHCYTDVQRPTGRSRYLVITPSQRGQSTETPVRRAFPIGSLCRIAIDLFEQLFHHVLITVLDAEVVFLPGMIRILIIDHLPQVVLPLVSQLTGNQRQEAAILIMAE